VKLNTIAGFVLLSLAPALSHAGAVNWTSQKYNLYAYLDIDTPEQPIGLPQLNMTAFSLAGLPNISTASLTSANGEASAALGIENLSNSTYDIVELSLNAFSSYNGGTSAGSQYSYVVPSVSVGNQFVADSNILTVTYDFSSLINLTSPTAGQLSYNGLFMGLSVVEDAFGATEQELKFVDNNFETGTTVNKVLSGSGTAFFNVTPGKTYNVFADISPDLFTSGTVLENSSNSVLTLGFSNVAVAAVPEPETYAMLLAGLVLVGFSARRQTQA
jgi:hypothetical protein